jgi:tetratricopeptide (TPR) repeat protein
MLLLSLATTAIFLPTSSQAQNAHLGTETELDRAMQESSVKERNDDLGNEQLNKVDKAEVAAIKSFLASLKADPKNTIQQGEKFAAKFPMSRYLPVVYGNLTISYYSVGNVEKMLASGTKALQLDPANVDVMSLLAVTISRRVKPHSPDAPDQLETAETYARRTIELIPTFTKPSKMDEATFEKARNDELALAYSGLGLVDIDREKYSDARAELTRAIHLNSAADPVDYYLLGNANARGGNFGDAVAAFEKCSAAGPLIERCQAALESVKHAMEPKDIESLSGAHTKADSWYPQDIDDEAPEVASGTACPLDDMLAQAGKRLQEMVANVDKFTATETVEHQNVGPDGRLKPPETRKYNYLVSIEQMQDGYMNVEEYRDGGSSPDQFPDHIATVGTPSLVLIFHPNHAKNFKMTCEGLGQWQGRPAWLVHFEERTDHHAAISALAMSGQTFGLRLKGRAWILADSYHIARLESDLMNGIPEIRLRLQHEDIEYGPVNFQGGKVQFWLPASTKFYMDFRGHRFYRLHQFTDYQLFSIGFDQKISDVKN